MNQETKYYWKGVEVFPVPGQQFSTHWNCYYNQPTENGGSRRIIISIVPSEITFNAPVEVKEENKQPTTLNIDLATYTSIREALGSGIGRVAPKTFIRNRPDKGYKDFAQFRELNKELENVNWEELEKLLTFE